MTRAVSPVLTQALLQLRNAVATLEGVVERRAEDDRSITLLKKELAVMQDDRAQIALDLDDALEKSTRLAGITEEVSRRVDRATEAVRDALNHIGGRE
jgi:predicted  nucleic acid-binding Zn-ribbon protein